VVTSEERIDYVQRAMMAGAQGYVVKPIRDPKELANTVREVRRHALDRRAKLTHPGADTHTGAVAPPRLGRRIAVFSSKGGQGKTTIAVNLAVMLRVLTDKSVLLTDTNLRFGEVNIFLDLPFGRSIVELLPRIDELDSDLLTQVLVQHSSGVQVLMRPERPELAEMVTGPDMEKVLTVLPRMFDYVVMDCEVSYDERLLAVLDRADTILLVLTPELGAVRNAQHFLELSQTLGYPQEKTLFVLNRAQSNVGLAPAEVERALGRRITFHLGSYGRLLATSLNMGKPLVLAQPRSEFTRRIREIAERISKGGDGTQ
jgi:pilus assembly protein CpaE